ncbi:hypothetical protein [Pseudomonas protegens]|uniref:hypothetical protein n=1 Tax=Pseudomonas protegens TaxID=380021 RepID=UPI001F44D9A8|nr:hypothetical protein [Pseudomonas protegens]MDS9876178.1 hypothetical protein [Pseudomonas protegens]
MADPLEWCVVVWNTLGSTTGEKGTDWSTLGVAAVTGLVGILGSTWNLNRQSKAESRSVRAALLAEVGALLEVAERRGYLKSLHEGVKAISSYPALELEKFSDSDFAISIKIPDHYNRIYQENVKRLGTLSVSEAMQIVRFYQLVDSLRVDVTEGGILFEGTKNYEAFQEAAQILETAMAIARSLTAERKKFWRRFF